MSEKPFYPRPGETVEDWNARLAAMDPLCLTCHQRQRRQVWLEIARTTLRKQRRGRRRSRPAAPAPDAGPRKES